MLTVCAAWFTLPLGLILAPQHWALWCALGGAAQGGGLTVIFALIVRKSRGLTESRHFSATVQGGGYLVAAAGPAVIGAVHEATGTWTVPMLVVLASLALLTVAGTLTAGGRPAKSGSVSGSRSPTS
jgi:MFS transporter, CP family, cyanate transporter